VESQSDLSHEWLDLGLGDRGHGKYTTENSDEELQIHNEQLFEGYFYSKSKDLGFPIWLRVTVNRND
jgi:hypothetical protein